MTPRRRTTADDPTGEASAVDACGSGIDHAGSHPVAYVVRTNEVRVDDAPERGA
jgi:hypothetical protein